MSLQSDGYLSPDMPKWIAKHRAEHAPWFNLVDRLSRIAHRLMLDARITGGDNESMLMVLFYARAMSSFQGAVVLVERGMTVEANTLARSCLESAFYLGAVANDPAFIDRLISSNTGHKKKVATWLTSTGAAVTELTDEQKKRVGDFLEDLKTSGTATASIVMEQAAQKAKLGDIYELVYRDLSNRAAHPTLDALLRHIEQDANGEVVGLRFGPDATDIRETILAMTTAMFCAMSPFMDKFPSTACETEIGACWQLHTELIDKRQQAA
jgi:hypothetical protein